MLFIWPMVNRAGDGPLIGNQAPLSDFDICRWINLTPEDVYLLSQASPEVWKKEVYPAANHGYNNAGNEPLLPESLNGKCELCRSSQCADCRLEKIAKEAQDFRIYVEKSKKGNPY